MHALCVCSCACVVCVCARVCVCVRARTYAHLHMMYGREERKSVTGECVYGLTPSCIPALPDSHRVEVNSSIIRINSMFSPCLQAGTLVAITACTYYMAEKFLDIFHACDDCYHQHACKRGA